MSVVIRPVEAKDKSQWIKLWSDPTESYLKFYKSVDKVTPEITESTWNRFFDDKEPVYCAVAEVDGEVIGFTHYLTHRDTWMIKDTLYLNDLYVSPQNRLSGVGRKLIEYVYGETDRLGAGKCYWCTQFENHRAQLLYTKVGVSMGMLLYCRP